MQIILRSLPRGFHGPLALVQHRSFEKDDAFISILQSYTHLSVIETEDKERCREGFLYVAPPDYHLLYDNGHWALSADAAVKFSRPSIDVLFESVATGCANEATAVLLTGASSDGAAGLYAVHANGGRTAVQDPVTAEARIMPQAGLTAVPHAEILTLDKVAAFIAGI